MNKIAWSGELVFLEAKWTDKDGHTVKFRLAAPNEERPNPFKAFTKKKSGKAGTIFEAALQLVDGIGTTELTYNGRMMLASWADTSTNGYTVSFWVEAPENGRTHPFEGFTRGESSWMAVLVEPEDVEPPLYKDLGKPDNDSTQEAEGGETAESAPAADDSDKSSANDLSGNSEPEKPDTPDPVAQEVEHHDGTNPHADAGSNPAGILPCLCHDGYCAVDEGYTLNGGRCCRKLETKQSEAETPAPKRETKPRDWHYCVCTDTANCHDGDEVEAHTEGKTRCRKLRNVPGKGQGKPLAQTAAIICGNPKFWEWITIEHLDREEGEISDTEMAANWMREKLGIESRRELKDDEVAERFHNEIRRPFVDWQEHTYSTGLPL